ncbi:MAG: class I tRNA ligase family protein, partial [archaeon]|nr:class I tRNA ligase family protein [archaeon]
VSSWAALGYPSKTENFKKFWPAALNIEGTDQFRGWWNSELILSTIAFDKKPFETIMVHGLITDLDKVKMSKSRGNVVTPKEVIEKHNRDFLRFYLASQSRGQDVTFSWDAFRDISRFFNTLWNSFNYTSLYLDLNPEKESKAKLVAEDKWFLSKLNSLVEEVNSHFENYEFFKACSAIDFFVLEELSRTYIKLVRPRVGTDSGQAVSETLSQALFTLAKIMAPITPHLSEYLYQGIKQGKMPESVHLLELPKANKKLVDKELEKEMALCKQLAQTALSIREQEKLRLRWPLKEVVVQTKTGKELGKVKGILAKMCNVQTASEVTSKPKGDFAEKEFEGHTVLLNKEADDERKELWELMELRRKIQSMRKQAKLVPQQTVKMVIGSSDEGFLKKYQKEIEESTNTKMEISKPGELEKLLEREFSIELKA